MAEEKEKKEEELKIVTDDPKDLEAQDADLPPKGEEKEEDTGKKKVAGSEETGEEEEVEEKDETRHGHDEEDEEERPRDRKSERQSRKQRQREARERQAREMNFLRKELERVDRDNVEMRKRLAGQETRSYDSKISELDRNIRDAEQIMREALDAKNGADHTEAVRIRDQLVEAKRKLVEEKEEHVEETKEEVPQNRRAQPDPEVVRRGQAWLSDNTWFKTDQRGVPVGQDSKIARAIDQAVLEDGFTPDTDEYWDELNRRVKTQLPHLFKKGKRREDAVDEGDDEEEETRHRRDEREEEEETPRKKTKGPKFRVGGRERPLKSNEVYLPKERIEALKEAGIWDDPEERARYLKAYKNYDAQNPST